MVRGCATSNSKFAYFNPDGSNVIYKYTANHDRWETLPPHSCSNFGLITIDGLLTTVGGWDEAKWSHTGQLFTLHNNAWEEIYPPLSTPRSFPAVTTSVLSGNPCTIAIGGFEDNSEWSTAVELLSNSKWKHITNTPERLSLPSVVVCNDMVHVIGSDLQGYFLSLHAIFTDNQTIKCQNLPAALLWTSLPSLPLCLTTPASMCEELVLVGGRDNNGQYSSAIHQLSNGEFVEVGHISKAMCNCLVTTLCNKMIVVGGYYDWPLYSDTVETIGIATVV